MADSRNVIGKFSDEIEQTVSETANDVKDEVGQMVEQGVQSITGTQLTPQQIQEKQENDQRKIVEARRKIDFFKQTAQAQQKVRQENKQQEMQKQQNQKQEQQVVEIKKEEKKSRPVNPAIFYAGKAEFKRGVGG